MVTHLTTTHSVRSLSMPERTGWPIFLRPVAECNSGMRESVYDFDMPAALSVIRQGQDNRKRGRRCEVMTGRALNVVLEWFAASCEVTDWHFGLCGPPAEGRP